MKLILLLKRVIRKYLKIQKENKALKRENGELKEQLALYRQSTLNRLQEIQEIARKKNPSQ